MAYKLQLFVLIVLCFVLPPAAHGSSTARKLAALGNEPPLVLQYHNGRLLKGNITFNVAWYGKFASSQRSILLDFAQSLSTHSSPDIPTVSTWWRTTDNYRGGPISLLLGKQLFDDDCSLGKTLSSRDHARLARRASAGAHGATISAVFTAKDVAVEGFCMSRCGTHGSAKSRGTAGVKRAAYLWVGNSETQCPGQCAWPFHQPVYGPQGPPLVAPNGDVGVDGMVISLATVLAGVVTNPFQDGYFQGPAEAPLEAVTACSGVFGSGAYPGYPGKVLVDGASGGSYNAGGVNGRKYLLPAMWDPITSVCSTLV